LARLAALGCGPSSRFVAGCRMLDLSLRLRSRCDCSPVARCKWERRFSLSVASSLSGRTLNDHFSTSCGKASPRTQVLGRSRYPLDAYEPVCIPHAGTRAWMVPPEIPRLAGRCSRADVTSGVAVHKTAARHTRKARIAQENTPARSSNRCTWHSSDFCNYTRILQLCTL
jgi:hypothetical protein